MGLDLLLWQPGSWKYKLGVTRIPIQNSVTKAWLSPKMVERGTTDNPLLFDSQVDNSSGKVLVGQSHEPSYCSLSSALFLYPYFQRPVT